MRHSLRHAQCGFTIVELMIATSVFSVILLISTVALIQVNRYYQKGVTSNNTQETTRNVLEDMSGAAEFATADPQGPFPLGGGRQAYCIDNIRYTFILNSQVSDTINPAKHQNYHALWKDDTGGAGCSASPPNLSIPNPGGQWS